MGPSYAREVFGRNTSSALSLSHKMTAVPTAAVILLRRGSDARGDRLRRWCQHARAIGARPPPSDRYLKVGKLNSKNATQIVAAINKQACAPALARHV